MLRGLVRDKSWGASRYLNPALLVSELRQNCEAKHPQINTLRLTLIQLDRFRLPGQNKSRKVSAFVKNKIK